MQEETFLRAKQVCGLYNISKTTLYKFVKEGVLPAPLRLGTRMSVWPKSALDEANARLLGQGF